jgi:hypothetical protein
MRCRVGHASVASEPTFACQPGPAVQARPGQQRHDRHATRLRRWWLLVLEVSATVGPYSGRGEKLGHDDTQIVHGAESL